MLPPARQGGNGLRRQGQEAGPLEPCADEEVEPGQLGVGAQGAGEGGMRGETHKLQTNREAQLLGSIFLGFRD